MAILIGLLFSGQGCNRPCDYPYMEGLRLYLQEIHHVEMDSSRSVILYITPLDGCNYCVRQNLMVLGRHRNARVLPVLIDKSYNPEFIKLADRVIGNHRLVLFDSLAAIHRYRTGYLHPLLLHIEDGQCRFYLEVTDEAIPIAERYLKLTE